MITEEKLIIIIEENQLIKAKKIASLLGVPKSEINSKLYTLKKKNKLDCNNSFQWTTITEERLITIVENHQPIKAKKIASLLGLERREINSKLYTLKKKNKLKCNDSFEWSSFTEKEENTRKEPSFLDRINQG
jgi:predicted ArsR family transcriptional regulator